VPQPRVYFTQAVTSEIDWICIATEVILQLGGDALIGILRLTIAFALLAGMTALVLISGALLALPFRGRTQGIEKTREAVSASTKSLYAATTEHLQSLKAAKTDGA